MKRTIASLLVAALMFAETGLVLAAQSPTPMTVRSGSTAVIGTAWNADTRPLANARVRLRNISTGQIDAQATTNGSGEFQFANVEGGTYVTELLDSGGNVAAVGESFTIAPGQTVVTFVRLRPRRAGLLGGLWGNAALAALAAAAGLGITAADECNCDPVSPELPAGTSTTGGR